MSWVQDLRYAVRQWRRAPGYASTALITLALGIGANTAIFLLTYAILLKSLPVPHPEELVRYTFRKGESELGLSYPQYEALASHEQTEQGLFAWHDDEIALEDGGRTENVRTAMTTGSVFDVLQLQPALGRGFDRRAGERGMPFAPEILLGYDYWRVVFHGDPQVVGRSVHLGDQNVTIVGVLPVGFEGVEAGRALQVLAPLSLEPLLHPKNPMLNQAGSFWLTVMGRLKQGQTLRSAQANLDATRAQVSESADPSHRFLGGFFAGYEVGVDVGRGGRSRLRFEYTKPLLALEGLCALMMLLCALNVGLLVLSKVSRRVQEFAIRNALGATRGRLLSQVVTETLVLGVAGLAAGSLLGLELAKTLVSMISEPGAEPLLQVHVGLEVFGFAAGVSLLAACLAGIWPAWRASRTAPAVDLKQAGNSRATSKVGMWLIPAQVTLGVLLLNAALLLSGTLLNYLHEHSGFAADTVVMADLPSLGKNATTEEQRIRSQEFLRQVETMPGVESATATNLPLMDHAFSSSDYYSHRADEKLIASHDTWGLAVTTNYFATMGTRILEGRSFRREDLSGDHVCVLSAAAAKFFFPDGAAVGQMVSSGDGTEKASDREACRVIGVAEDARLSSMLSPAPKALYDQMEVIPAGVFIFPTVAVRAAKAELANDAIRRVSARVYPERRCRGHGCSATQ
ncbi:MAG TPA: ABC transporter permease [Candidatus Koribacter sp.]